MQSNDIERLFNEYSNYILYISRWYAGKYRFIEVDDLYSFLSLQFVESCNRFDPMKIATFKDFIHFTIQKRAIDYLRSQIKRKKTESLVEDAGLLCEEREGSFEDQILDKVLIEELLERLRLESPIDADFLYEIVFLDKQFSDKNLLQRYNLKGRDSCFRKYQFLINKLRGMCSDEEKF